jgi:hypothetical protein
MNKPFLPFTEDELKIWLFGYPYDDLKRWLWLMAVEWTAFPSFILQPVIPILLIFISPIYIFLGLAILNILWTKIRYLYFNLLFSYYAVLIVAYLKWPAVIISFCYLIFHKQYLLSVLALAWPWLSGVIAIPGKIGIVEIIIAAKIGFIDIDTDSTEEGIKVGFDSYMFHIGNLQLNQNINDYKGKLNDASLETYHSGVIDRFFADEMAYKPEPISFLNINWDCTIAVTNDMIYKISLYGSQGSANSYNNIKEFFSNLYGKPAKKKGIVRESMSLWDIPPYDPQWNLIISRQNALNAMCITATSGSPFKNLTNK